MSLCLCGSNEFKLDLQLKVLAVKVIDMMDFRGLLFLVKSQMFLINFFMNYLVFSITMKTLEDMIIL